MRMQGIAPDAACQFRMSSRSAPAQVIGGSMTDQTAGRAPKGPRCIALVGPYLSGKTTLLEAILFETGAIQRQGKVSEGSTVGDGSAQARSHGMSVELNAAGASFM